MTFFITFRRSGRTGNLIFQYMMCKLLSLHFGHSYISHDEFPADPYGDPNTFVIDDNNVSDILHRSNERFDLRTKHLYCNGYFQVSSYYINKRTELLELLYDPKNEDVWRDHLNQIVRLSDYTQSTHRVRSLGPNDLVVSLRLDDFIHPKETKTNIVPPIYYKRLLSTLQFRHLYIVVDKIRYEWEAAYISQFAEFKPIILQEDLLCDMALLRDCPRLIHSNSTLCWICSFMSREETKQRFIPITLFYDHQYMGAIDEGSDRCMIMEPMKHADVYKLQNQNKQPPQQHN